MSPRALTLDRIKERASRVTHFETDLGRTWQHRCDVADESFRDYSWDWTENQRILHGFRTIAARFGTYVSMGHAVVANIVNDISFRNPVSYVQDKSGNVDLGNMLTDVFKAVNKRAKSGRAVRQALWDNAWAGFGLVWTSFLQEGYEEAVPLIDPETGEPFPDPDSPDGEPLYDQDESGKTLTRVVPIKQEIIVRRVSPWRVRFDPEGRLHDLSDHNWIGVEYFKSLKTILEDERIPRSRRDMLGGWFSQRRFRDQRDAKFLRYESVVNWEEKDPGFIRVPCVEIWDRVNKKIIQKPWGADFHLTENDWPDEFIERDVFPCEYIALNQEVEDEDGLTGFMGIPWMRMIRPHLLAINRLEALFLEANTHVINKYLTPAGFLSDQQQKKLTSDRNREVIEYDRDALNKFGLTGVDMSRGMDVKKFFMQVPSSEIKEVHHLNGIAHELDMISQVIGQTTGERGGLAEAGSATEALGLQRRLEQRLRDMRAEVGEHHDALNERMFLILKRRQGLPIQYQRTTKYNEKVWQEFHEDDWADLDLHFEHAAAPEESRTPEEEIALRRQVTEVLMPVLQARGDVRAMMALARMQLEPLRVLGLEKFFNDDAVELAKQLLALQELISSGELDIADTQTGAKQVELISSLIDSLLTDQDIQEVVQQIANAPQQQGGGGETGPLRTAKSAGQIAAAEAAAGAQGGIG